MLEVVCGWLLRQAFAQIVDNILFFGSVGALGQRVRGTKGAQTAARSVLAAALHLKQGGPEATFSALVAVSDRNADRQEELPDAVIERQGPEWEEGASSGGTAVCAMHEG